MHRIPLAIDNLCIRLRTDRNIRERSRTAVRPIKHQASSATMPMYPINAADSVGVHCRGAIIADNPMDNSSAIGKLDALTYNPRTRNPCRILIANEAECSHLKPPP